MKEQYFKVPKSIAARAGLDARLREEVDEDFLLLSEKDIRMISLTIEERVHALGICPLCEQENDELRTEDNSSSPEITEEDNNDDDSHNNDNDESHDDEYIEDAEQIEDDNNEIDNQIEEDKNGND